MKYLMGVTSAGVVSFLSHGWGGCVSVKEITLTSRFLDYLQHAIAYLLIVDLRGIALMWSYVENFTIGKTKMSGKKLIHLEKYQIYAYMLPESLVD